MWGMWMTHRLGGWGIAVMVLMFVFWALMLAGIFFLAWFLVDRGRAAGAHVSMTAHETALDILQKRFARGEITAEQYQQRRAELEP